MPVGPFEKIMEEYSQKVRTIEEELNQEPDIISGIGSYQNIKVNTSPLRTNKVDLSQDSKLDEMEQGLKTWVLSIDRLFSHPLSNDTSKIPSFENLNQISDFQLNMEEEDHKPESIENKGMKAYHLLNGHSKSPSQSQSNLFENQASYL